MIDEPTRRADRPNLARTPVLATHDLEVSYDLAGKSIPAVRNVSFRLWPGEALGIVGESGSGKSTIAYAIMRYLPSNGRVSNGRIVFQQKNILEMSDKEILNVRGKRISLVPQDPLTSLNPSWKIGDLLSEILRIHLKLSRMKAFEQVIDLLQQVNIADPFVTANKYPHEISGGQQQRVLISMAFCLNPDLIVMDEPTTGLDVTTEAVIIDLIKDLKKKYDTSILYITHNLGVVKKFCDRVITIYAGEVVEEGDVKSVFNEPKHPYTLGLLRSIPRVEERSAHGKLEVIEGSLPDITCLGNSCSFSPRCRYSEERCFSEVPPLLDVGSNRLTKCFFYAKINSSHFLKKNNRDKSENHSENEIIPAKPLLEVINLKKHYTVSKATLRAVEGISFECNRGEVLGIVGESGCGKTTLARCIVGLLSINEGQIIFDDQDISVDYRRRKKELFKKIQMVFQNPEATLNPQKTVENIVARPLTLHKLTPKSKRRDKVLELLNLVKLNKAYLSKYPHELSGGEKQRVGIAKALALEPEILICDEPISSLDVSIQAGVLNLLMELQKTLKISYLFVSHDLNIVRYLSNRIMVMYMGKICEVGRPDDLFDPPYHPYTEALLSAIPFVQSNIFQKKIRLEGSVPSPIKTIGGCVFHSRCPRKVGEICETVPPLKVTVSPDHVLYCHIPLDQLKMLAPIFEFIH